MIHFDHVSFSYRAGVDVLRLDRFELDAGDNLLVVGPSGCGKTTFLHLVAGLLVPTTGRVIVNDCDLARLSPPSRDRFRGRNIGIILQRFHLLPTLTTLQNLLVAQSVAGLPADRAAALAILDELGVADRASAYPHEMSVGQQQRVAIARALVNQPWLLLADEPTSNLDDETCEKVIDLLLSSTRRHGASLLVATHDSRLKSRLPGQLQLPRRAATAQELAA